MFLSVCLSWLLFHLLYKNGYVHATRIMPTNFYCCLCVLFICFFHYGSWHTIRNSVPFIHACHGNLQILHVFGVFHLSFCPHPIFFHPLLFLLNYSCLYDNSVHFNASLKPIYKKHEKERNTN